MRKLVVLCTLLLLVMSSCQPRFDDFMAWELENLEGVVVELEREPADLLFINLWATWCGPCIKEFESMNTLVQHLGTDKLRVVAISDEDLYKQWEFIAKHPELNFEFVIRQLRAGDKPQASFPRSFIFDSNRKLVFQQTGSLDWSSEEMIKRFESWLGY